MFQGRKDYNELLDLNNAMELELYECAEVNFHWDGENIHSFNRLFCVFSADEKQPSVLELPETGSRVVMKTNSLYFLSADDYFRFAFRNGTHFFSFHFNVRLFAGSELFHHRKLLLELPDNRIWLENLREILSLPPSGRTVSRLKLLLYQKISELPEIDDAVPERHRRYRPLFAFLHEKADALTTIQDLAQLMQCSADTLSRHFSRDFSTPLKQALLRAVAARAERMLRNPDLKIRDVAALLHFNDEYYFSKFFKRETGRSPTDFRRHI